MSSSHTDASDEELMLRYQGGDRPSFALLVRRHNRAIYNFALRLLRHGPTAEEVVQDAFMRVIQNAGEFRHAARFSTWLYAIVRNLCIDQMRKGALRRHASLDEPSAGADGEKPTLGERTADSAANVERAVMSIEIRQRALAAIHELPEEQREVFLLKEVANLPFREIAAVVGAPENTIKSRMRYALERLQEALGDFEEHARGLR